MSEQSAADLIAGCERLLARRIRTLRQSDCDWSMRTSELVSSSVVRMLDATDGGRQPISRGRFIGLLESVVRSVVVDGIRRRTVRRAAQRVLREQAAREGQAAGRDGGVAQAAEARALAERLVASMKDDERVLLRLRLDGREWSEVAAALGISADAARQRWAALRARMRALAE